MKKIFAFLFIISAVGLFVVSPFKGSGVMLAAATSFPDIKSPVLLEAVNYLNDNGVIKGYPDGTYKPDQVINRAEALKIIFESRGISVDEDTNSGFPDVDSSLWFAKYVTSAKKLGLISGYADGTYKPTQFVNKAEFMKIAMLAQSYYEQSSTNDSVLSQFNDLDPSAWYIPYLGFALNNEFVDRVSKFNPTDGMSRGEAALIIYRVAKYNEGLIEEEPEPLPYLSCETCVNGVDLSQYEWSTLPFVKIENGKLWIDGYDETSSISVKVGDKNIQDNIERAKLKYIPMEEKNKVDQMYPELYERAIGISGGVQDGDMYLDFVHPVFPDQFPKYIFVNKDGLPLLRESITTEGVVKYKCEDCAFENLITSIYQGKGYPPFEPWIGTDEAKPFIYDVIQVWLKNEQ